MLYIYICINFFIEKRSVDKVLRENEEKEGRRKKMGWRGDKTHK